MIVNRREFRDVGPGLWVGVHHPDGRHLLTDELDLPAVKAQRKINKDKCNGGKGPWPAEEAIIRAWFDELGVEW